MTGRLFRIRGAVSAAVDGKNRPKLKFS